MGGKILQKKETTYIISRETYQTQTLGLRRYFVLALWVSAMDRFYCIYWITELIFPYYIIYFRLRYTYRFQ